MALPSNSFLIPEKQHKEMEKSPVTTTLSFWEYKII